MEIAGYFSLFWHKISKITISFPFSQVYIVLFSDFVKICYLLLTRIPINHIIAKNMIEARNPSVAFSRKQAVGKGKGLPPRFLYLSL